MKPRITINGIVVLLVFLLFSTTIFSQTTIPTLEVRNSSGGAAITSGDVNVVLQPWFYVANNDASISTISVEIATDQFFGSVVATQTHAAVGVAGNSETQLAAALSTGTTYYARASADNGIDGDSPWTSLISFTTTIVSGAPTASWPTGGVDVYSVDVDLSYYANGNAVQFEVVWGTDSNAPNTDTPAPTNLTGNQTHVAFGTIGTDLSYPLTSLTPGVTYYWYVRYTDDGTNYSVWSAEAEFTVSTTLGAVTPTPSWPVGGALVYTDLPTLYWFTMSTSTTLTYEVVWSLESDNYVPDAGAWGAPTHSVGTPYTADFMALSGDITGTSYTLAGTEALAGDTYDWYIRSSNDGGTTVSAWSAVETFEVNATDAATLTVLPTYPVGGAVVYTNSPTLYWYTVGADPTFEYQVYVVTGGGTAPTNDATTQNLDGSLDDAPAVIGDGAAGVGDYLETGITDLYTAISGCVSSQDYDWYVRIYDPASLGGTPDYSAWTAVSEFTTDASSGTAVVPVLIYPANGEMVYTTTPTFSWMAYSTATLEFEIVGTAHATDVPDNAAVWGTPTWTGAGTTAFTENGIATTNHILSAAIAGVGTYRWFVRSRVGTGTPSDWSTAGEFEISPTSPDVLQPAILLNPVAGISVSDRTPTFIWSEPSSLSSITYEIEVNLYSDFRVAGNFVIGGVQTGLSGTTFTGSNDLALGTTYYWRITSSHASFADQLSATGTFFVLMSATAAVPIPGNPIANAAVSNPNPQVSWFLPVPDAEAVTYDIEFSQTIDFANKVVFNGLTESKMVVEGLEAGKQYFWRVKSKSSKGESGYSLTEAFRLPQGVTGISDLLIPAKFDVEQNYPNPFNPSTTIKYSVPEATFVSIRVYDMLGQEVKTLLSSKVNAGVYDVTWNGTDNFNNKVSTGAYIYRVIAGENIITKKMVLLK